MFAAIFAAIAAIINGAGVAAATFLLPLVGLGLLFFVGTAITLKELFTGEWKENNNWFSQVTTDADDS